MKIENVLKIYIYIIKKCWYLDSVIHFKNRKDGIRVQSYSDLYIWISMHHKHSKSAPEVTSEALRYY